MEIGGPGLPNALGGSMKAEKAITALIDVVDWSRSDDGPSDARDRNYIISTVDALIKVIKKMSGPREIGGTGEIKLPVAGAGAR